MADIREFIYKIILLGDGAVGKTSLVLQYTERKFNDNYIMSIGANFAVKIIELPEKNMHIRLQLWDLAGQPHFKFVRPIFYRGAFVGIFVFDITTRSSFENIRAWVKEARQYLPYQPIVLVGNKIDLIEDRVVSRKEGEQLAKEIGAIKYFETSAKTGKNIDEMFCFITEYLIKNF